MDVRKHQNILIVRIRQENATQNGQQLHESSAGAILPTSALSRNHVFGSDLATCTNADSAGGSGCNHPHRTSSSLARFCTRAPRRSRISPRRRWKNFHVFFFWPQEKSRSGLHIHPSAMYVRLRPFFPFSYSPTTFHPFFFQHVQVRRAFFARTPPRCGGGADVVRCGLG